MADFRSWTLSRSLIDRDQLFYCKGNTYKMFKIARRNFRAYAKYPDKFIRNMLRSPCVYINTGIKTAYIGKTKNFLNERFFEHDNRWSQEDWNNSFLVVDPENFGDAEIAHLERTLYRLVAQFGNYRILNRNEPPDSVHMDDFIRSWLSQRVILFIKHIISIAGYNVPLFGEIKMPQPNTFDSSFNLIQDFIDTWTADFVKYTTQEERRVGWRFVSKLTTDPIDSQETLEKLQIILLYMYEKRDSKYRFPITEESIEQLVKDLSFMDLFKRSEFKLTPRQNFIRMWLNYLEKLRVVEKTLSREWKNARITQRGEKFINAKLSDLNTFFVAAIEQHVWPNLMEGIPLRKFARNVQNILKREPTELEFKLILSHGGIPDYTYNTESEIAELITELNNLPAEDVNELDMFADRQVKEHDEKRSGSSLANMRGNIPNNYRYICQNNLSRNHTELLKQFENDGSDITDIFEEQGDDYRNNNDFIENVVISKE